jgi:hypothetical protein
MIEYADKDRDGAINFEEFTNIVTKVYPKVWSWSRYALNISNSTILKDGFNTYLSLRTQ